MSLFHIVHVIPDSRLHILNGYNEVIKTLIWGLRCFGHEVTYAVNQPRPDARNLVLGANMLAPQVIDQLPADTIIYNLEQVSGMLGIPAMAAGLVQLSQRFTIWDYSDTNIVGWRGVNPQCRIHHVPIAYAPALSCIEKAETQDIDALIYGGPGETRLQIFNDLCLAGLSAVFVFGLYDQARDDLIARSKLVLNISHSAATVFSIVRTSYLLANRKAVIADIKPGMSIDADLIGGLKFTTLDDFVNICVQYAGNDPARAELEQAGFDAFSKRDIRLYIGQALGQIGAP